MIEDWSQAHSITPLRSRITSSLLTSPQHNTPTHFLYQVWDVDSERCLHTFSKANSQLQGKEEDYHESTVRCIQFDDLKIVSASADRTVKLWKLA